jgi:hypothetical protein
VDVSGTTQKSNAVGAGGQLIFDKKVTEKNSKG